MGHDLSILCNSHLSAFRVVVRLVSAGLTGRRPKAFRLAYVPTTSRRNPVFNSADQSFLIAFFAHAFAAVYVIDPGENIVATSVSLEVSTMMNAHEPRPRGFRPCVHSYLLVLMSIVSAFRLVVLVCCLRLV